MKKVTIHNVIYKSLLTLLIMVMQIPFASAQLPTNVPSPESEPLDLTVGNIIFYIVIPLLMIIAFFWYRRKRKPENKKD